MFIPSACKQRHIPSMSVSDRTTLFLIIFEYVLLSFQGNIYSYQCWPLIALKPWEKKNRCSCSRNCLKYGKSTYSGTHYIPRVWGLQGKLEEWPNLYGKAWEMGITCNSKRKLFSFQSKRYIGKIIACLWDLVLSLAPVHFWLLAALHWPSSLM